MYLSAKLPDLVKKCDQLSFIKKILIEASPQSSKWPPAWQKRRIFRLRASFSLQALDRREHGYSSVLLSRRTQCWTNPQVIINKYLIENYKTLKNSRADCFFYGFNRKKSGVLYFNYQLSSSWMIFSQLKTGVVFYGWWFDSRWKFPYFGSQKKILTRMMTRQEETKAAQQRKVTGSSGGILSRPVWRSQQHCSPDLSPLISWPC